MTSQCSGESKENRPGTTSFTTVQERKINKALVKKSHPALQFFESIAEVLAYNEEQPFNLEFTDDEVKEMVKEYVYNPAADSYKLRDIATKLHLPYHHNMTTQHNNQQQKHPQQQHQQNKNQLAKVKLSLISTPTTYAFPQLLRSSNSGGFCCNI